MLSFIKRKLSESDKTTQQQNNNTTTTTTTKEGGGIDSIIIKTNQMSLENDDQVVVGEDALLKELGYKDKNDLKETVFDTLRSIRDPEKDCTLEDLNVVYEAGVFVLPATKSNTSVIRIEFNPTVPHCSLATLIGLCIRIKVERSLPHSVKLDIYIKKGAHTTEDEINKQINDKERIAAAMENPNLRELVEKCIQDPE